MISWMMVMSAAWSATPKDARAFFDRYVELGNTDQTVAATAMYAPDAKLVLMRAGTAMEMSGAELQALTLKLGEAGHGDRVAFKKVKIKKADQGLRIRGERHSITRCYTDDSWWMMLAERNGELKIIEEHSASPGASQCAASPGLARHLDRLRDAMAPSLPMALDDETRLDTVTVASSVLVYGMTLVNVAPKDVDVDSLSDALASMYAQSACAEPTLRSAIEQGATIRYSASFSEGTPLRRIDVTAAICTVLDKN